MFVLLSLLSLSHTTLLLLDAVDEEVDAAQLTDILSTADDMPDLATLLASAQEAAEDVLPTSDVAASVVPEEPPIDAAVERTRRSRRAGSATIQLDIDVDVQVGRCDSKATLIRRSIFISNICCE